jgi:hypothetical protein
LSKKITTEQAVNDERWREVFAHIATANTEMGEVRDKLAAHDIEFVRIHECMLSIKKDVASDTFLTKAVLGSVLIIFGALVLHLFKT